MSPRNLYVIACGAGPAADLHELILLAKKAGWDVYVGTTPAGWHFIDPATLTNLTTYTLRCDYSVGQAAGR